MQNFSDLELLSSNLKNRLNSIIQSQYSNIEIKNLNRFGPIKNGYTYRYYTEEFPIYIEAEIKINESNVRYWFIEIFDSNNNNSLNNTSILNFRDINEYKNLYIPLEVFRQDILLKQLKLFNPNFRIQHIEDIKNYFSINPANSVWLITNKIIILEDKNNFVRLSLEYISKDRYMFKHINFGKEFLYSKNIIDLNNENTFSTINLKKLFIPLDLEKNKVIELINKERFNDFISTSIYNGEDFYFDNLIEKLNIDRDSLIYRNIENKIYFNWLNKKTIYELEIIKNLDNIKLIYKDKSNNLTFQKNLFEFSNFNLIIDEILAEYIIKYNNIFIKEYRKNIKYIFNNYYKEILSYEQLEQILNSILNIGGSDINVFKSGISWYIINKGHYYLEFILPNSIVIKNIYNNIVNEYFNLNYSNINSEIFLDTLINQIEQI